MSSSSSVTAAQWIALSTLYLGPPATAVLLFGGLWQAAVASLGALLILSLLWPRWLQLLPLGPLLLPFGLALGSLLRRRQLRLNLNLNFKEPLPLGLACLQLLLVTASYIGVSSLVPGSRFPIGLLRTWMLHSLLLIAYYQVRHGRLQLHLFMVIAVLLWTALVLAALTLRL